jgi:hypothetical protein
VDSSVDSTVKRLQLNFEGANAEAIARSASGRNHDRAILFASPLVLVVGCWQFGELGIIAGASHLLRGLYLSPDLDLISRPYKRWGVLRFIWLPDQRLIPYRSPLSHAPVLGLLLRLAYLAAWLSNGSSGSLVYRLVKGDRVSSRSRAISAQSSITGWLAVAVTSVGKTSVERVNNETL